MGVLEGLDFDDLDGGIDSLAGYHSLREGVKPVVSMFPSHEEECAAIVEQVKGWLEEGIKPPAICIAARVGWLVQRYLKTIEAAGVEVADLDTRGGEMPADAVRVSTLHRLKGTEFSKVILAAVHQGVVPLARKSHGDEAAEEDYTGRAMLTGSGKPSPFVKGLRG